MDNFKEDNFHSLCNKLATKDQVFASILSRHGYPPFWSREPGFPTLIQIILEQQVSLASARAAFLKLQALLDSIAPAALLALSDTDLKNCYFSRQKIVYARHLSEAIIAGKLDLKALDSEPDQMIRQELRKIKGLGDWTVDVYLMMALHRLDCFPLGDVALVKSLKENKNLPHETSKETLELIANEWKPFRTIAAFLLWHAYIMKRKKVAGR